MKQRMLKRFFTVTLAFMLIFSAMPAVPVLANPQGAENIHVSARRNVLSIYSGGAVVGSDGSIWAWGGSQATPIQVLDGGAVSVFTCSQVIFFIKEDNSLWAWGRNHEHFPLGDGTNIDRPTPVRVMENVATMGFDGGRTRLVLQLDGTLWAWGSANFTTRSMFGIDLTRYPQFILDNVASFSFLGHVTAIVRTDGGLYTMGINDYGQLGNGTRTELGLISRDDAFRVLDNVASVYSGRFNTMAIQTDGSLWTWGRGGITPVRHTFYGARRGEYIFGDRMYVGLTGDGSATDRLRPVRIMDDVVSVAMLSGGGDSPCRAFAVQADGTLWGWGENSNWVSTLGIGDGRPEFITTPVRIMDSVLTVSTDRFGATHVVRKDGSLWAFGRSHDLMPTIGDGNIGVHHPLPTMIMGPGSVSTEFGITPQTQPTTPVTPPAMPPITTPAGQFTITTTANPPQGGTASGGGTFQQNADVTLTATPNQGWTFAGWFVNGNLWSQNLTESTQALGNWTFEARFTQANQMPPITTPRR